jgi:PmbA protein
MTGSDTALAAETAAQREARLLAQCEDAVARAVAQGADEAEAFAVSSSSIAVRYEKGDLQLTQVDEGTSLGLRVFKDRKQGFASSNQAGAAALDGAVTDALALAGFSPPDDANVLLPAAPIARLPDLVEPALAALTVEDAVERARELMAMVSSVDPRLSIDQASTEVSSTSVAVTSSTGVAAAESDAAFSQLLFGMAVDGEDVGGFDYQGDAVRRLADADAARAALVERFCHTALGNLGAGAAETYRGTVLFAPAAFADVFIDPLVSACSAIAVQRGRSALAGKLGQAVAVPALSITDDPTDLDLGGAASFDREGQPCGRYDLLADGVLRGLLYNGYAARMDGVAPTGHAAGGARGVPGLGPHAIVVGAGDGGDEAAMLAALGRGLLVQRFSGTVDPASGDFSGVAKSARWVEGGKVVRPVRETLISGNALQLLAGTVTLSTERERLMGAARIPFGLVDGVSVTAG